MTDTRAIGAIHVPEFANRQTYRFRGLVDPASLAPRGQLTAAVDNETATIRLLDPIDSWGDMWGVSAGEFLQAIDELPASVTEIRLHINSPGGEVFEGVTILNGLRSHPARVVAVVDGIAASIASVIACGADELIMSRTSRLMIHDAWGICVGNAADMRSIADILDGLSNDLADVYSTKAGGTVEEWRDTMRGEAWYSASEAVASGLADSVDGDEPSQPEARFDLAALEHVEVEPAEPEASAEAPAGDGPAQMSERQKRRHRMNQLR